MTLSEKLLSFCVIFSNFLVVGLKMYWFVSLVIRVINQNILPFSAQTNTGSVGSDGLLMLTAVLAMTLN